MAVRLSTFTYLAFEVNAALDTGNYSGIGIGEIKRHIDAGDILQFLSERLGDDIDLSLFRKADEAEIVERIREVREVLEGRERKKTGICRNGLCLLIAYCLEIVQRINSDNKGHES